MGAVSRKGGARPGAGRDEGLVGRDGRRVVDFGVCLVGGGREVALFFGGAVGGFVELEGLRDEFPFVGLKTKLDGLEGVLEGLEGKINGLEGPLEGLEAVFDGLEGENVGLKKLLG